MVKQVQVVVLWSWAIPFHQTRVCWLMKVPLLRGVAALTIQEITMQTVTDLFENGVVEEDVLDTLEWAKLLNFQESYEKIAPQTDSRKLIFIKWNCP